MSRKKTKKASNQDPDSIDVPPDQTKKDLEDAEKESAFHYYSGTISGVISGYLFSSTGELLSCQSLDRTIESCLPML